MRISRALPVLALIALSGCGGHVIRPEFAPNHGRFDFSKPPCKLSPQPALGPDEVGLRYLGAGGLYIEWQGNALLMAPFFSNPSTVQVLFSPLESDRLAVREGLQGTSLHRVRALAAGHSHYDHLGDLPLVARDHVPGVPVYVNRTGANALASELPNRVQVLEEQTDWVFLKNPQGNDLPIRFRAVESKHAPHFWGILLAGGPVPFLTNGSANGFLGRTRDALKGRDVSGPEGTVCGPSSPGWTMPMPGEWMRFKARGI